MIALLLLAATPSHFAYTILGEGTISCGEWLDRRRAEPNRVLPESAWVSGYITAMALTDSARTGREIAHGLKGSGIDHWVDNYCAVHPVDNIEAAASTLVRELKTRVR